MQKGCTHIRGLQAFCRILCHHGKEKKPCPLCENGVDETLLDHVLKRHAYGPTELHHIILYTLFDGRCDYDCMGREIVISHCEYK